MSSKKQIERAQEKANELVRKIAEENKKALLPNANTNPKTYIKETKEIDDAKRKADKFVSDERKKFEDNSSSGIW